MHENHLFMALPLLIAVAGRDRGLAWLALGASVASFLNMALHDPDLPYALPGFLAARSSATDLHLARPYTWLQLVGMFVNSLLVLTVAAAVAWRASAVVAAPRGVAAPGRD